MTDPQERPPEGSSPESDVTQVVRALHRTGPLPLGELARVPDLNGWPGTRIEHAVIVAWSRNLIFVDPGDQLVAL
jgi:hypothetical protein